MPAAKEHSALHTEEIAAGEQQEVSPAVSEQGAYSGAHARLASHGQAAPRYHDTPPSETARSIGHWIHTHKDIPHKGGAGFLGYQVVRSAIASIPYGISMASTLAVFTGMERAGARMVESAAKRGETSASGAALHRFATFGPVKLSALVATSFTLYRGTSKTVKWLTEYLFNPRDSEEKTVAKVRDLPNETWRKIKEIGPAEASSTPIAAVALGFVASAFHKGGYPAKVDGQWQVKGAIPHELDWTRDNFKNTKGFGPKAKLLGSVIVHPKARFIEQALINTIGYSLFFEIGDRLYKDRQIKRGIWAGDAHSTKALKATPDAFEEGIQRQRDDDQDRKYADSAKVALPSHGRFSALTDEPTVTRFVFRRVLPTFVGITAYTAFKFRHSYMFLGDFDYKKGPILKNLPKLAGIEGLATSLFFLIPWVSEPWEKRYDAFADKLEKKHPVDVAPSAPPPIAEGDVGVGAASDQVQKNYNTLLDRINAKDTARFAG